MNALITEYLTEIEHTLSPRTVKDYRDRLKRFSVHLQGRTEFTRQVAVKFILSLNTKEFGPASISLHQSTLKSFYGWLAMNGYIDRNFLETNAVPAYRSKHRDADFLFTADEYERIKVACLKIQNPDQLFWYDACVCAWNTGLRMGDVAHLSRDQIKPHSIIVTPNKTVRFQKTLEIPIVPELQAVIDKNTCVPLLFPEMAKSYDAHGNKVLSVQFGRLLKSIGIAGKSFHSFRHRMASALLNSGTPPSIVSSITGQTLTTLQRYSHVTMAEKIPAMERISA